MQSILKKIVQKQFFFKIIDVLMGIIVAYASWSLSIKLTIFSTALFFIYLLINQRITLFIITISYYLFASKGLLIGTDNYFENSYLAVIIWLSSALIVSSIWIIIWSPSLKRRLYLFPIMLTILILPPIGFISWVNPIISSAIAFPKQGFLGVVLYLISIYLITLIIHKQNRLLQLITTISILSISSINFNTQKSPTNNHIIHPINSNLTYKNQAIDFIGDYRRQKKLLSIANKSQYNNLLFHENALGAFTQNSMMIWERLNRNKTILAGAYIYRSRVGGYDNVLMEITNHSYKTIYKQRVPVPITMWRPWIEQGAKAYPFKSPTITYKQSRVGVFICYEQLLTYTYFHTMFYNPKYIIGISNLWWVEDDSIGEIQKRSLELWGRLFNKKLYYSENH